MQAKYKAGFLVPKSAIKSLSDDGWEFDSDERLPNELEACLAKELTMISSEKDCARFEGDGIKVDVFKDLNGQIENLYFRFYNTFPCLPPYFQNIVDMKSLEFFVPSSGNSSKL